MEPLTEVSVEDVGVLMPACCLIPEFENFNEKVNHHNKILFCYVNGVYTLLHSDVHLTTSIRALHVLLISMLCVAAQQNAFICLLSN